MQDRFIPMDPRETTVALLSIHPQFAEAILEGRKKVEFRKTRFRRKVDRVVLYATQPIGAIVGWFDLEGIEQGSPRELWRSYGAVGGIKKRDFTNYYGRKDVGYAYRVANPTKLSAPASLAGAGVRRPPQSYMYLETSDFDLALAG